jgi:riboflavin synthase
MFTGLIADVGRLARVSPRGRGLRVAVEHQLGDEPVAHGESVALDGCCLTALEPRPGRFEADLSPETASRTGGRARWRPGRPVNLERAVAAGNRLGGHIVQGHADGTVRVVAVRRLAGGSWLVRCELPREARPFVIEKGSVALDGVSLTVARTGASWFEMAVIPETLRSTTLHERRPGDRLIVEWDILARYAARGEQRG